MLPTDSDFLMLYGMYLSILVLLIYGIRSPKNRRQAAIHFIFFALYSGLMFSIFLDPESFKNGSSILVLYYGFIFPMIHFMVFVLIRLVKSFQRKPR